MCDEVKNDYRVSKCGRIHRMDTKKEVIEEKQERITVEAIQEEIQELKESEVQEESIRVQKAKWVREQVEKQREIEDATRERIEQEQKILDEMKRSTEEHLERTKELRQFNEDTRAQMRQQVYEINGITEDKLQGMAEYKNAYYQGMSFAFFILSVALIVVSGLLHGFDSQICLFMVAFTGIEGALLSQESKRGKFLDRICRFLYVLMFPAMLVIFVCYELEFEQYSMLLPYFIIAGCVILLLGTLAYFTYNPYRKERKKLRSVKDDLKEIEDEAEKAVKRNQKRRKREEARLAKKLKREQKRLEKKQERDVKKQERKAKQEEIKAFRKKKWEEIKLLLKKDEEEPVARIEKKDESEDKPVNESDIDVEQTVELGIIEKEQASKDEDVKSEGKQNGKVLLKEEEMDTIDETTATGKVVEYDKKATTPKKRRRR